MPTSTSHIAALQGSAAWRREGCGRHPKRCGSRLSLIAPGCQGLWGRALHGRAHLGSKADASCRPVSLPQQFSRQIFVEELSVGVSVCRLPRLRRSRKHGLLDAKLGLDVRQRNISCPRDT